MARILATGIATLDIVNEVSSYPEEDTETRALAQRISRGGNASNTLCVLSQFDHQCYLAGVLVDEADGQIVETDLAHYQINTQFCPRLRAGKMPTSYITLNRQTGSRTIVHYRDCPELNFEQFQQIELAHFDWLHFEGRNLAELTKMLEYCRKTVPNIPISLEIEKPRDNIETLFGAADWLFFSKDYAETTGHQSAESLFATLPKNCSATCSWGASGAYGLENGKLVFSPPVVLSRVVDTLGAGDTFNAGMIHGLLTSNNFADSLHFSNQLAARKCQQHGFNQLLKSL